MSEQRRIKNGEYTFKEYGTPEIAPLVPAGHERELGIASRQLDKALAERHRMNEEISELALYQVALHAVDAFPEAASIRLEPEYDTSGMMATAVLDAEGNALAESYGTGVAEEKWRAFSDWLEKGGISRLTESLPVQDSSWFQHAEAEDEEFSRGYMVNLQSVVENSARVSR